MVRKSGIYLERTRKPHALIGLPVIGRHNGYVGQSTSYFHRHGQHVRGGGTYNSIAKPWSDLEPKQWRILPLPRWMFDTLPWFVDFCERMCILLLLPVYNDSMNHGNPRRIPLHKQRQQRASRDKMGIGAPALRLLIRWAIYIPVLYVMFTVAERIYA